MRHNDTCQRPAAVSAARVACLIGISPRPGHWRYYIEWHILGHIGKGFLFLSFSSPTLLSPRGIRGSWGAWACLRGSLVIALSYRRRDSDMRTNHSNLTCVFVERLHCRGIETNYQHLKKVMRILLGRVRGMTDTASHLPICGPRQGIVAYSVEKKPFCAKGQM